MVLQLKGCVFRVWGPSENVRRFGIFGVDRRTLDIYFFPDRKAVFRYVDESGSWEVTLTDLRGTVGTHYFGRIWHLKGHGIWFGYRLYPSGCEPVVMQIETVAKTRLGVARTSSALPEPKDKTHSTFVFCQNSVFFQGMELQAVPVDVAEINAVKQVLERNQSPP